VVQVRSAPLIRGIGLATLVLLLGCGKSSEQGSSATPPAITSQPANQTVTAGQTATFSVAASGTAPLNYQWQENNVAINGATSSSFTTPATTTANSGETFLVVVSNSAGSVTSQPATLTVNAAAAAGTDVTTFKNDLARTGQNLTETVLTPSNVNSTNFGLLRNLSVAGKVDAQPLYLSQLSIGGAPHNVVFAATEHDMVYAFDADTGATLWSVAMTGAGETTSDDRNCGQVSPEIGVTATPVIDRKAGPNGAIFVVAMSKDSGGNYHQRLHALDLTTGAELFGGPKEVQASYPTATGMTTFVPGNYKERPGLLLLNGIVYTAFSSHCDIQPYTGWLIGYNETTLAQSVVFNIAPNSNGGGPSIWMSGVAPAVDASGNIFLLAANGVFESNLNANGFPNLGDFGNSFLKISTANVSANNNAANNSLSVADYFEMSIEATDNAEDLDLGSGGAMLLPDLMDSSGTVRHLAVGAGKDGNLYVVNRDNLGKFSASGDNIWQEFEGIFPNGNFSGPAYFNGTVYYGDVSGTLKAFAVSNAKLSSTPASQSATVFAYPGTSPVVSANAASNAIVWAAENVNPAVLHAYDGTNLGKELYNSSQAGTRDQCGNGNKFITPTVADGKVFLGTQTSVCVFGSISSPGSSTLRTATPKKRLK
jgi:Immunoglobulin domain/PQQ-like domain